MNLVRSSTDSTCPSCQRRGLTVPFRTIVALSLGSQRQMTTPRLCTTPGCPVVYFDHETSAVIEESEMSVPVWLKHPDDPTLPVCYCFDHTVGEIRSSAGTSEESRIVSARIVERVRSGDCDCTVKNPKGACCLGDVISIEREQRRETGNERNGARNVEQSEICCCR